MNERILIVDDEAAIRKLLTKYLEEAGFQCENADGVSSAKKVLAVATFDLLVTDLKMPGESGLDLIRYAKSHFPEMGRIMITGYGAEEIAAEVMEVGIYGYIIKPATKEMVLITVKNALRHLRLNLHMQAYKAELEKKLSLRTEKLLSIMNNLNAGVVMVDRNMNVLELSKKMQAYFPDPSFKEARPCYAILNNPPGETLCSECPMQKTLMTGKVAEATRRIGTIEGERDFRIVTSPVVDKSGTVYAGIGLYEDITEKLKLERDLRQAQKLETIGQLAAGIAHEINTPVQYVGDNTQFVKDSFDELTPVLNTCQLWQESYSDKGVSPEMNKQMAEVIEAADIEYLLEEIPKALGQSIQGVGRIEKIVRAMKDFSHPGSDEKTATDINKLLETTITVSKNEWKYVAEIESDLAPDLPFVPCHAGEIGHPLKGLLSMNKLPRPRKE
jgi:two-component system, NtrC family, sensor kinase